MLPGCHDQPGGQQARPLPAPRPSQVRQLIVQYETIFFLFKISGLLFTFDGKGVTLSTQVLVLGCND